MKLFVIVAVLAGLFVASQANNYVIETGSALTYTKWYDFAGRIDIRVRAGHDVHILLANEEKKMSDTYEIVIGADFDQRSLIRKDNAAIPQASVDTPAIVSADVFTGFWIRYIQGTVLVGRKDESIPFLKYTDKEAIASISTFAVSTGYGAVGSWVISTSDDNTEPIMAVSTSWVAYTSASLAETPIPVNSLSQQVVVRVLKEDANVPGYIDAESQLAATVWEGVTQYTDTFEVLTNYYGQWESVSNGELVYGLSAGNTRTGVPLFVGRIMINDVMTMGYVLNGELHVAFKGAEFKFVNYEILM